jgi:hypothetical protein
MKKWPLVLICVAAARSASADPIPGYMLDTEYKSCINGPGGASAQKTAYCLCVRNKMAGWDLNTLLQLAQQAQNPANPPPLLQELAKECVGQIAK